MTLLRSLTAALLLPFLTAAASAEPITRFALENGLEVVVIEDHRAPVVVQMLWYRAGAADEPAGKSGIAHFLEHLMFKGTEKVASGQFSATVEANGGNDNAFTSWDYTAYFQRVSADRLELMMEMEADRMRGLILSEEDVLTERQVILEERGQRVDSDPGALLSEQMRAALFLNHRYGIPIIGWRHEIAALTREDALAWYRRYYAPNNATLVIAGDATPEEVRRLAEKYYGPLKPSADLPERLRPQEPPAIAARRILLQDERVSDPYIYRMHTAPARESGAQEQAASLSILAQMLGGNPQTSYLSRALSFDRQIATYVAAHYSGTSIDDAVFTLVLVPAPGVDLAQAEAELDAAIARFLAEGPDPAAFERVKTQARAAEIYARDSAQGLANMVGEELSTGLTLEDVRAYTAVRDAVSLDDLRAAANLVLDSRGSVTGWLQPVPTAAESEAPLPDLLPLPQDLPSTADAPEPELVK